MAGQREQKRHTGDSLIVDGKNRRISTASRLKTSAAAKFGDFGYVANSKPVSVPVLEPNFSASMPSRWSMLT